jgi:hypothetical protein
MGLSEQDLCSCVHQTATATSQNRYEIFIEG